MHTRDLAGARKHSPGRDANDVIDGYLDAVVGDDGTHRGFIPLEAGEVSPLVPRLKYIRLLDGDDKQVPCFATGDPAKFAVGYDGGDMASVRKTAVSLTIFNARGFPLTVCASAAAAESISGDPPNPGEFVCAIDKLPLVPGQYSIEICSMNGNAVQQKITGGRAVPGCSGRRVVDPGHTSTWQRRHGSRAIVERLRPTS